MYLWGNTSHSNIIKSLKNRECDRPPTSHHAWTGFRHHVRIRRTAYQPHISAQRDLCTRHRVVLASPILIRSTLFLIQEVFSQE